MPSPKVWVFFYGSYMNPDVPRGVDLAPGKLVRARLSGFDIVIAPRANRVRSDQHAVESPLLLRLHLPGSFHHQRLVDVPSGVRSDRTHIVATGNDNPE